MAGLPALSPGCAACQRGKWPQSQPCGLFLVQDGRATRPEHRETAQKLLEVSEKAQERARCRDEGYALITAQNAAAARGKQRGRD
jgi:hypothetical protein